MKSFELHKTMKLAADYFDGRKVGCFGNTGYRKTTDLSKLSACIDDLAASGIINPGSTVFADLGCGDGRVNLLISYFVRVSIGIEIDSEILSEYAPGKNELISLLKKEGSILPPENIFLFHGSSLDDKTFDEIRSRTGVDFGDVDLFYTYITLHDVFAEKIAERGRPRGLLHGLRLQPGFLPSYESFRAGKPGCRRPGNSRPVQEKRVMRNERLSYQLILQ